MVHGNPMRIEGGGESAREGVGEADDIRSDIDRAGRTGSTLFEVGVEAGMTSINPVYANDIEDNIKEKTKKMLGKLGGRSKMVSSRHVGGVKKNPMAEAGGGSGMAAGRDDEEFLCEDNDGVAGTGSIRNATAAERVKVSGSAGAANAAKSKSSVSPSVPRMVSPRQRVRASSDKGGSMSERGGAGGAGSSAGGARGDDGISEGVESKRPDLMISLDDDRLNRTGSMEIDGGGKGDGDGGGDGGGGGGGNVNEGAEAKGADDDDRREERENSIRI